MSTESLDDVDLKNVKKTDLVRENREFERAREVKSNSTDDQALWQISRKQKGRR